MSLSPSFSPPELHTRTHLTSITHRPTQTHGGSGVNAPSTPTPNPLASAALYLYTFLATLVLLVGISLFIVIRSIVQRRRRNRAFREAWLRYTNGSLPIREGDMDLIRFVEFRMNQAGVSPRGGILDLTKVPKMWDVHLAPIKFIELEKTAEGKFISSSWKLNQRSNYLDLKTSPSPPWAWTSILPLSSSPLVSDQAAASNEVGPSLAVPANLNGRRNVPVSGVGRFFGRLLHSSGSAPASSVSEQSQPSAPVSSSSPSTIANNPTPANPIDSVDGSTPMNLPSSSWPDDCNLHHTDTDAEVDTRLEEGTLHMHGSSGSSSGSSSQPHPYNSNTTNPSISQTPPNADTTTMTERAESSSTHPSDRQPAQGVGEVYVSHKFPLKPRPIKKRTQRSNQNQEQNLDKGQHQKSPSGTGVDVDKSTQMRVAVLVRMPTPPTASTPTPLPHSGMSKTESKAKAKAESGYDSMDSAMDEKRFSSSSVLTLGGGDRIQNDMETDGVQVPLLEVGLADVDVIPDCQDGGGWPEVSSE